MQASLFDAAPEPNTPAPVVSAEDDFVDIFADVPDMPVAMAAPEGDLMAWCRKNNYHLSLGEVVLRAKTIEANILCSAGPEAEMQYLLETYRADPAALRAQIIEVARILRKHNMQPGYAKATDEMSL